MFSFAKQLKFTIRYFDKGFGDRNLHAAVIIGESMKDNSHNSLETLFDPKKLISKEVLMASAARLGFKLKEVYSASTEMTGFYPESRNISDLDDEIKKLTTKLLTYAAGLDPRPTEDYLLVLVSKRPTDSWNLLEG